MVFPILSPVLSPVSLMLPVPAFVTSTISAPLAFLDGIGSMELLLVFVLALVLFGGKGLPNIARGLGRAVREFKKATSGVEEEIKRAMESPVSPPSSSKRPATAARTKSKRGSAGSTRRPAAALPADANQTQAPSSSAPPPQMTAPVSVPPSPPPPDAEK